MGFVKYEQDGFIGVITINRPEALNALNTEVIQDLDAVLDSIDLGTTRVLVVTGAGEKSFVAGADIAAMSTMTVQEAREFSKAGNDVFRKLETLPIPSIAAVNGFALGGGNELAMSCDIRYCSENAMFGQPEVGLGITPGFGGTQRLARLIGTGKANEMVYAAVSPLISTSGENARTIKYKVQLVIEQLLFQEVLEKCLYEISRAVNHCPADRLYCYSSITSNIILALNLKPFWKIRQSVVIWCSRTASV